MSFLSRLAVTTAAACLMTFPAMAQDAEAIRTAEALRDRALEGTIAYEIVEQITTRFGPRLAGTAPERAAAE